MTNKTMEHDPQELDAAVSAAARWACMYPIPSFGLAQGEEAVKLGEAWGASIAHAVLDAVAKTQHKRAEWTEMFARDQADGADAAWLGDTMACANFCTRYECDHEDCDAWDATVWQDIVVAFRSRIAERVAAAIETEPGSPGWLGVRSEAAAIARSVGEPANV